jgi:hypothetical protein
MNNSPDLNVFQYFSAVIGIGIGILPIIAVIWLFAWLKDIRQDTRKIREVLKRKFPDEFKDD